MPDDVRNALEGRWGDLSLRLSQLAFQALMAERRIPIHYGVVEFREDLQALRQTERI
jgi:hypothetical protein